MHDEKVQHRDLKLENILIKQDSDGKLSARICDFGWAKDVGEQGSEERAISVYSGTQYYSSPQQIRRTFDKDEKYTLKLDIWALGLIFHILITGEYPFEITKRMQEKMINHEGTKGYYNYLKDKRFRKREDVSLAC